MRDRTTALVRVAGEQDVAGPDRLVEVLDHFADVGAELPDDHPPARIRDHRELVVLLPDHRTHRRAGENGVHLVPRALESPLDDVDRDRVEVD